MLNLQLLKTFYDVAMCGSINKAARINYVSASNICRSIQMIEKETNLVLFKRTYKGMKLTQSGEEFLVMVEPILHDYFQLQKVYCSRNEKSNILRLTLCVHQNSLATQCLINFYNKYSKDSEYVDIVMAAFPSMKEVLENMRNKYYMLGVVQYSSNRAEDEENLFRLYEMDVLATNRRKTYVVINKNHPLAGHKSITLEELKPYTRVAYINEKLPDIDYCADLFDFEASNTHRRILIKERGQIDDIVASTDCYFLGCGNDGLEILEKYSPCVSIPLADTDIKMITALICRKDNVLTKSAKDFIEIMKELFNKTEQ